MSDGMSSTIKTGVIRLHGARQHLRLRQLALSATSTTFASSFGMQFLTLVTGALTARLLGVEGRGAFAACTLIPALAVSLGSMGGPISYTFMSARQPELRPSLYANSLITGIVWGVFLVAIGLFASPLLLRNYHTYMLGALASAAVVIPCQLAASQAISVTQGAGKFLEFNVLRSLSTFIYFIGVCLLFYLRADSVNIILLVSAIANMCFLASCFFPFTASYGHLRQFNLTILRKTVHYALRAHLGSITAIESLRVDLAVIVVLLSARDAGLYSVALAIPSIMRAQTGTLGMVAIPSIAKEMEPAEQRRQARRFLLWSSLMLLVSGLLLFKFIPPILTTVYGHQYAGAILITKILVIAMILASLRQVLGDIARALDFPGVGSLAELVSIISLAITLPLMLRFGLIGAASCVTLAYGVSLLVTITLLSRRGFRLSALIFPE